MKPRLLVGCESSGVVRDAFTQRGWNAWSCDLLPTESPGQHYQCDVREVLGLGWDLFIVHPTCTYLANSGVRWLYTDPSRWQKLQDAAAFFSEMLQAPVPCIAAENPIMHKHAKALIGVPHTQVIQPWMFGHMEQKATCLWLKNLPPLQETHNVKNEMMALPDRERQRMFYMPPSKDRWKMRSKTFTGIAAAMADQWSKAFLTSPAPPPNNPLIQQ